MSFPRAKGISEGKTGQRLVENPIILSVSTGNDWIPAYAGMTIWFLDDMKYNLKVETIKQS
ncbi:MAG: hypothetical protein EPO24_12555 [Bacteroidetes bacterium]|nr:MAG: hypothetical protein EPO24_12555 [Bacteroidota bacterium]